MSKQPADPETTVMNEAPKTPKDTAATKKAARVESYDIAKSDETLDLAKDLAKFIKRISSAPRCRAKSL